MFVILPLLILQPSPADDRPPPTAVIRMMLNGIEFDRRVRLIEYGDAIYDQLEEILADPKSKPLHVGRVFVVLRDQSTDRSRFVAHALHHLGSQNDNVRWRAIELLEQIGTGGHSRSLIVLLSDSDISVVLGSAKVIARHGDAKDLQALDLWLRRNPDHKMHNRVKTSRDELEKRVGSGL